MHRLIDQFPLRHGAHSTRDGGMCAMEMVAWLAGEEHSDEPSCACPVIAAFVRACNDAMSDETRDRFLRPLVPILINTRSSRRDERERAYLVLDHLVRVLVPARLRRSRQLDEAAAFASLEPVAALDHLAPVARALDHFGRDLHAARWVVQQAREGAVPARFVAGAVQLARSLNDAATWTSVVCLIEAMAKVGRPDPRPAANLGITAS